MINSHINQICLCQTTHLIIADGYRWMQKVADLPQVLKALCLQLYPLTVSFLHSLVHQYTYLLDLGYRQGLIQKNINMQTGKEKQRKRVTDL